MNFRALDPGDSRAGMSAVSTKDRQVWAEFYDPTVTSIREHALEQEFHRLWDGSRVGLNANQADAADQILEKEMRGADRPGVGPIIGPIRSFQRTSRTKASRTSGVGHQL